jgi:hypothetical protein
MISSVYPDIRYQKRTVVEDQPAPLSEIDAGLAAGSLTVVRVDYSPDPGVQGHWVVLHEELDDDYQMWDPWKRRDGVKTLVERFGFAGTPAEIIREVIWFGRGVLPKPGERPLPKPEPAGDAEEPGDVTGPAFTVQPNVEGLTFRRKPEIRPDNIIKYLTRNAKLLSLEPIEQAQLKIGQQGQWLRVRDIEEEKGYVAAWYVTPIEDPVLGVAPVEDVREPTRPEKLVVATTVDSLSLRSEPRVAVETLLGYLPRGTELLVVRTSNALDKIGQHGQWLQVRTLEGIEGHVAAWFVERK